MKKTLLTLSLFVAGIGATFSQSTIWSPKNINIDTSWGIRYMSAVDANIVWGIAYDGTTKFNRTTNQFVMSTNGGTFTKGIFVKDTNVYNPSNISAVNASIAYIAVYGKNSRIDSTSGKILKTVNGGITWANASDSLNMFRGTANFPDFVHFWNANNGICLGDPNNTNGSGNEYEIWRTSNGGTNWARVAGANIPNPSAGEAGLTNSYFASGKRVWFGTSLGRVYNSLDSGKTWAVGTTTGLAGGVQGLAFRDSVNGICWGGATATATSNTLKKTNDGGTTWTAIAANATSIGLYDFCAVPGRNAYMSVGSNSSGTYVTSVTPDDGLTWNVLETGTTRAFNMIKVQMIDSVHGWAGSFSDATSPHGLGGMNVYMGPKITLACPVNLTANKTSMCLNDSITLTAAGATTYSWSTSATTSSVVIHPTASGVYTVTGTLGSCTNTQTVSITVTPAANPNVTMSSLTTTVCAGSQIALTGNGATTYSWTPSTSLSAATGTTVYAHPTVNTTYSVIGTSGVCKSTTTFTLIANPTPGPTVTVNTATICPTSGGSATLTANGATTYSWSPATNLSSTTGASVVATPTAATTVYMVTGTTGSCLSTKPTTVTVSPCTGINQVSNTTKIVIYPNPSTGLVTVTMPILNEGTVMYVTDMIGKEVYKTSVTNINTNLDLTGLQKGMYMLTISNGKSTQVQKIIIGQ